MATMPREALDYVTREINGVSEQAQQQVMLVLEQIDWSDITAAREIVVQAVQMALSNATTLAAQASADFYDASRTLCIGEPMGSVAISGYEPEKTDRAIRSFVRFVERGEVEKFNDQVLQRMDYEVKRSAGNSMFRNGANDTRHPKFARVPQGSETCDFCLMLASRGFVYSSKMSAGGVKLDHYHSGCFCRVVAGWDGDDVEGYDTDEIYDRWQSSIDAIATERAEKRGTTVEEERSKIMLGYANSAKNAKKLAKAGASKA